MDIKSLIDKLYRTGGLSREEFCEVIGKRDRETEQYARDLACRVREKIYGNNIYIRGLIEFTAGTTVITAGSGEAITPLRDTG